MLLYQYDISFMEVPDECSLVLSFSECPHRCRGCHSPWLWKAKGQPFGVDELNALLTRYGDLITCVCFMGGEWHRTELKALIHRCWFMGLKTCLYTALSDRVGGDIKEFLDYLKTGAYVQALGGLDSPTTNQRFIRLRDNADLTHMFTHKGKDDVHSSPSQPNQ